MSVGDEVLGMTAARTDLPKRIRALNAGRVDRVFLLNLGKPVAVLLSLKEYERLLNGAEPG